MKVARILTPKEKARREDRAKQKKFREFVRKCVEEGARRNRILLGIVRVREIRRAS